MNRYLLGLLLLIPFACCGCEGGGAYVSPGFDFADVSGVVTLADGKPLKTGTIHFSPVTEGKGREDMCVVSDGKFTLKMAVGEYKVAFDAKNEGGGKSHVPAKYTKFETANLTASVKSGGEQLKFELK